MMILDGAMGTMIQRYKLGEKDFGEGRTGCNDVLVLTRPDVISEIHREYLKAGADIIETNSFNANSISLEEYGLQNRVREINLAAAHLAREAADEYTKGAAVNDESTEDGIRLSRKLVAGSMGPTNVALSLGEASSHGVDFSRMRDAFSEQAEALIAGGVDLLMLETIFDTLNAKAAIAGIEDAFRRAGRRLPLMISVTLTPQGRTLSGQTVEAFLAAIAHSRPWSVGMNCGFGAEQMEPWIGRLRSAASKILPGTKISLHPNAGLPDEMGEYTETPEHMATIMERYMREGIDIAGGCCGTTPRHISALREIADKIKAEKKDHNHDEKKNTPRTENTEQASDLPTRNRDSLFISGTELTEVSPKTGFLKIGERCNVAGSRKFLRLINEGKMTEALGIASAQIQKGAGALDINMDDGMLDAASEMERFVTLLGQDGATSAAPVMVDSSDIEVIRKALRRIQGKPIVNSISLKEGEDKFLQHAREIREMGAAVVVMAFDEEGQATDLARRIEICSRAYRLLTEKAGFDPSDIIFDPNILTVATGIADHDRYALDFLEAVEWIKHNLPGAKVSGGVSNLSFAFRGNNPLREAMHALFLEHAINRGMDMAIVNPSTRLDGRGMDPDLRERIEDVFFMRRPDATERLMEKAAEMKAAAEAKAETKPGSGAAPSVKKDAAGQAEENKPTLPSLLISGVADGIEPLLEEALKAEGSAMGVVSNRLMTAMRTVGDEFGAGRMFLPQVVRAAGVMKRAIDYLTPRIEAEAGKDDKKGAGAGVPFVIATVKGDVHDIGKNIVGVILKCGGFDVIDLGVMVDEDKIIESLRTHEAKLLGLSGLITPSLNEMIKVARRLEREGMTDVALFVGGATTSDVHTAVKIAPQFRGVVVHTRDAAVLPVIASRIADPEQRTEIIEELKVGQQKLRDEYERRKNLTAEIASSAETPGSENKRTLPMPAPVESGIRDMAIPISEVIPEINFKAFLHTWRLSPKLANGGGTGDEQAQADRLIDDANRLLKLLEDKRVMLTARAGIVKAHRVEGRDSIFIESVNGDEKGETAVDGRVEIETPRKEGLPRLSLSDFVAPADDYVGVFAVTAKNVIDEGMTLAVREFGEEYGGLLLHSLADRLVEGATEIVHRRVHNDLWQLSTPIRIRPAVGYAAIPDQRMVFELDHILDYSRLGVRLTENGALSPSSTTTGLILAAPEARYF